MDPHHPGNPPAAGVFFLREGHRSSRGGERILDRASRNRRKEDSLQIPLKQLGWAVRWKGYGKQMPAGRTRICAVAALVDRAVAALADAPIVVNGAAESAMLGRAAVGRSAMFARGREAPGAKHVVIGAMNSPIKMQAAFVAAAFIFLS
jgi:hypothetical protein